MKLAALIPTFNNGAVIRVAIGSALEQTYPLHEILVVADGAPPESIAVINEFVAHDPRVKLLRFPKGERHGEDWRHAALGACESDAVAYLSDDDFWFPHHAETVAALLSEHDFAHTRQVDFSSEFTAFGFARDLADMPMRERMAMENANFFGLSVAAHTLSAYKRLPRGWSPAPPHVATDLHMWRKWLALEGARLVSSPAITAFHAPRYQRRGQTSLAALNEMTFWREVFSDPRVLAALIEEMPETEGAIPLARIIAAAAR